MPSYATTTGSYTASDLAIWIRDVWQPEIGIAAYEEMRIGSQFKRLQAPEGKIHFRKHLNLQRNSMASSVQGIDSAPVGGSSLTPSSNVEVEVTGTPQTIYCYVRTSLQAIKRMATDPTDVFRRSVEMTLSEGIDVECGKKATDLINVVGSNAENMTEAVLQDAIVKAAYSMKSEFNPGQDKLTMCLHPFQIDDILGISNWVQAQIRGDAENPVVKGMVLEANGVRFVETANVYATGNNTFNNPIFVPNVTFGIGFNQEATVKMEDFLLEKRIIGWVDFALLTCWDQYGVNYKTTNAA